MQFNRLLVALTYLMFALGCGPSGGGSNLTTTKGTQAQQNACTQSGGTVLVKSGCASVNAFPSNCVVGAHGCAAADSKNVETCECASGQCWDGNTCKVNGSAAACSTFTVADCPTSRCKVSPATAETVSCALGQGQIVCTETFKGQCDCSKTDGTQCTEVEVRTCLIITPAQPEKCAEL